jgi:hypothetical protein
MPAPEPFAHQWSELMPQAMNRAANRFGHAAGESPVMGAAPQTGTDSSHGRAIVTPTPRRNIRRETPAVGFAALMAFSPSPVHRADSGTAGW